MDMLHHASIRRSIQPRDRVHSLDLYNPMHQVVKERRRSLGDTELLDSMQRAHHVRRTRNYRQSNAHADTEMHQPQELIRREKSNKPKLPKRNATPQDGGKMRRRNTNQGGYPDSGGGGDTDGSGSDGARAPKWRRLSVNLPVRPDSAARLATLPGQLELCQYKAGPPSVLFRQQQQCLVRMENGGVLTSPWNATSSEMSKMYGKPETNGYKGNAPDNVVYIRGGYKSYRSGVDPVLQNINMTVHKGEIYGLLGASGCGKTTLLSTIVGRRQLDSGDLRVFGGVPGDRVSGIPGSRVGYMPQELALYEEFTVTETVKYFGKLYDMSHKQIRAQKEFLVNLLEIPVESRKISSFSGGQKRRVSFLVSLLADPQLLILDEPTVGVDPILRQSIWNHLLLLATQRLKTIIITTHYIDEAKMAHKVGLLNGGRLLAEDSPRSLIMRLKADSLEDVFLKLCVKDRTDRSSSATNTTTLATISSSAKTTSHSQALLNQQRRNGSSGKTLQNGLHHNGGPANGAQPLWTTTLMPEFVASPVPPSHAPAGKYKISLPSGGNFLALLKKNFLKLKRNPAMLLFIFLLPAVQVIFFCIAIGQEPKNLRLGFVNLESDNCSSTDTSCDFSDLGCKFVNALENNAVLNRYEDVVSGKAAAQDGDIWGLLYFKENFSSAYVSRMTSPVNADQEVLAASTVEVFLDMSNQQVALSLQSLVMQSFDNFTKSILDACNFPEDAVSLPIRWGTPIYGDQEPSFTEFMAPGIIILIIYFLAVALTGEAFISERSSGLLDRSWVAGVKPSEIIASHIVAQCLVMLVQTGVTLFTIILGFGIPCKGPFIWLAVITILQGLAGMSFGFLISALCDSQAIAMQLSIGSFYPNLLLSGILWPLEGMPKYLHKLSLFLPNTLACQAMRDIMLRGWDIHREEVYLGVVASSSWIVIFLTASWIVVKVRH